MMTGMARGVVPTKTREDAEGNESHEYDRQGAAEKLAKVRGLYEGEDTVIGKLLIVRSVDEVVDEEDL